MTRQEAREILIHHNEWRRGGEGGMESPIAIGEAIDVAIEALGSPWIPVTERLPEYDEQVIVAYGNSEDLCFNHRSSSRYVQTDADGWCVIGYAERVTHWMAIPKIKED